MKPTIYKKHAPWPICKMPSIFIRIIIFVALPLWIYQALKEDKTFKEWWRSVMSEIIE